MRPRLLLMQYLDRCTPEQMRRHEIKPGITRWVRVSGRKSADMGAEIQAVRMVGRQLVALAGCKDLRMTVWKTLKREGISQSGQAAMAEFRG